MDGSVSLPVEGTGHGLLSVSPRDEVGYSKRFSQHDKDKHGSNPSGMKAVRRRQNGMYFPMRAYE